ncbi:MAG: hypothetical protein WC728_05720 [Elusimicrobiota bacterium]
MNTDRARDPGDPFFSQARNPLKKDEREERRERKGAGVPLYAGSGSSGVLGLGRGAAVIGARSWWTLLGPTRLAALLSAAFGGEGSLLGSFFASRLGAALVAAGMLAGVCTLAWLGVRLAEGWRQTPPSQENSMTAFLPAPTNGLLIDKPKNRSLDYLISANKGEIDWDRSEGKAREEAAPVDPSMKVKDVDEGKPADGQTEVKSPDWETLLAQAQKNSGMDKDAFFKKFTQSTLWANGGGGVQGEKLRDGLAGFTKTQTFSNLGLTKTVKPLSNRLLSSRGVRSVSTRNARSSRAMGQLKFAKRLSNQASNSYDDTKTKQYATDAFDQGKTISSDGTVSIGDEGITTPLGEGASGVTESEDTDDVPSTGDGTNSTPYQSSVDQAKSDTGSAASLKMLGTMLIVMGVALAAVGMALMSNPFTVAIGAAILAIGVALVAAGVACLMMGQQKANDAKGQGQEISDQYGQQDQGDVVDECSSEAIADGTAPDSCSSAQSDEAGEKAASNDAGEATETESKAAYTE